MSLPKQLEEKLSGYILERGIIKPNRIYIRIASENLKNVVRVLKEFFGDENIYIATIAGVDKPEEKIMEINYFIHIIPTGNTIVVKTSVPRDNPVISSLLDEFPGVFSGEVETYDLLGIIFEGNKYIRRGFFVPKDVADSGIYPLRKDAKV